MQMALSKSKFQKFGIGPNFIKDTPKAFYGKYLYKAELRINGVSMLRYAHEQTSISDFCNTVQKRKNLIKEYAKQRMAYGADKSNYETYFSSWERPIYNSDPIMLYKIYQIISKLPGSYRYRLESNHVSLFFNTDTEMFNTLNSIHKIEKGNIRNIWQPVNDESIEQLSEGVIFMKNPKFKFRVMIKEDRYDAETKKQILAYVDNQEKQILIPKGMRRILEHPSRFYMRGYFYTNDESLLMFLKMIEPNFVRKVYRLEQAI
jgi:hypothetical protein